MNEHDHNGLIYYTFDNLSRAGAKHAVLTRLGGTSQPPFFSLNLSYSVNDDPAAVGANHERVYDVLGIDPACVVTAQQVHRNNVSLVYQVDGGRRIPASDGLMSRKSSVALLMRYADCTPVLLFDRRTGAVGQAHAGWRGTAANIAGTLVRAMVQGCRSNPSDLVAGIGPSIGVCCYEVGPEVVDAIRATIGSSAGFIQEQGGGSQHVNLRAINARQLELAGVRDIEIAPFCTSCSVDRFFSHRAERGRTGRFGVLIGG